MVPEVLLSSMVESGSIELLPLQVSREDEIHRQLFPLSFAECIINKDCLLFLNEYFHQILALQRMCFLTYGQWRFDGGQVTVSFVISNADIYVNPLHGSMS